MKAVIYTSKCMYPYKVCKYLRYKIIRMGKRKFICFIGEFNSIFLPIENIEHFAIVDDGIITEEV